MTAQDTIARLWPNGKDDGMSARILAALAADGYAVVESTLTVGQRVTTGRGTTADSPNFSGVVEEIIPTYRVQLDAGGWLTTEAGGIRTVGDTP